MDSLPLGRGTNRGAKLIVTWHIEGHSSQYPWADWLDGRCWYLRLSSDFSCLAESIRSQAHGWGKIMGVSVTTRDVIGGVLVQAYPAGSKWKPNLGMVSTGSIKKCVENKR